MTVYDLIVVLLGKPLHAEVGFEEEAGAQYLTFTEPGQAAVAASYPTEPVADVQSPAPVGARKCRRKRRRS